MALGDLSDQLAMDERDRIGELFKQVLAWLPGALAEDFKQHALGRLLVRESRPH